MQKARIRTGWKNRDREISIEDFANALSAICWRLSLNAAKNLHEQDFIYHNDYQRINVIREYLFFLIHCADRLMHEQIDDEDRITFITALSKDSYRHFAQNSLEILSAAGGYKPTIESYIESLNSTMTALSDFRFEQDAPGYEMFRLLGSRVLDIMGDSQTNKWVIDQVMDIDGPEAYEIFKKSFDKLKRSSGF